MRLNKKKRGFTLIEIIVAMSLTSMMLFIATTIFISNYADKYKYEIAYSNKLSLKNVKLFIESQSIKNNTVKIDDKNGNGKVLLFKYQDDLKKNEYRYKEISLINRKLAVKTYTTGYPQNTSNITYLADEIELFIVNEKENLLYVVIENKNGVKEELCIVNRGMLY